MGIKVRFLVEDVNPISCGVKLRSHGNKGFVRNGTDNILNSIPGIHGYSHTNTLTISNNKTAWWLPVPAN